MNLPPADAHRFLDLTNFIRRPVRHALMKYASMIKWPRYSAKIMDIGCGDGTTTNIMLVPLLKCNIQQYTLTGVDKSPLLMSRLNEEKTFPEIDFEAMDISTKELDGKHKEKYDILFSFMCFHLVIDYNQWIKNVYTLLKPGGQTFFLVVARNPISMVIQKKSMKGKWAKYLKDAGHIAVNPFSTHHNPENWIKMVMRDYGFKSVKCKVSKESYVFADFDQLQEFIKCMETIYKDIPSAMLKEFLEEFTASVAWHCYCIPGRPQYYMMYTTLLVMATK